MIKVVLFDVDNTLLDFDQYVKDAMKNGFEKFGLGKYDDDTFAVFTKVNSALWHALERGELSFEELKKVRWNLVFEALGISFDGVYFENYFRDFLFDSAIPIEGAYDLLNSLKGKYVLGVASNGPYDQQINRLKVSNMLDYFSHFFISEEIGHSKPSLAFFDVCMQRLNQNVQEKFEPSNVMIVGDSLSSDIAGGRQCGMKTCFFNPKNKPVESGVCDFVVTKLCQLKGIL